MSEQIMKLQVNATTNGLRTDASTARHTVIIDENKGVGGTDAGANPLETVLAALAGCENAVSRFVAKHMNFDLQNITFTITGEFDRRGFQGEPGVRTYFQTITVEAKVTTSESEERLKELEHMVAQRCPVFNLLQAADVKITHKWSKA
jgi:putative redox protein